MNKKETVAVVYRVLSAYPFYSARITDDMIEDMIREWHEGLRSLPTDGVMEAVTMLITEQKWMPTLAEVIGKILDIQYGKNADIIRSLDKVVTTSSRYIIFGQLTEEQKQGYERLTPFQRLIIKSPYEFNKWMMQDYEWKEERVMCVKREIQYGKHRDFLEGKQQEQVNFNVFKALEERKNGQDQQQR